MSLPSAKVYRILAVDHEPGMLTQYRDILCLEEESPPFLDAVTGAEPDASEAGARPVFDLAPCATAEEALSELNRAKAKGKPFALALIEANLGDGPDGIWAAEQIRAEDANVEIVMVSARPLDSLSDLNRRVPPPEKLLFLQKPFRPNELRQLAASLCAKWLAECRLTELNEKLALLVEERTKELDKAARQRERDIDERLLMIREIWASERRYRLLFEKDVTGNFVADPRGRVLECNAAFASMFGFSSPEEAKGFDVFKLDFERASGASLRARVRTGKGVENCEGVHARPGLGKVYVIGHFSGVFDEEHRLEEIRGYFFNITERKKLEAQLRLAQKMEALGTLAGGIAHDFNNILGVVMGYAELIVEGEPEGSGVGRRAREIVRAGERARDLVEQILNFSRQSAQVKRPLAVSPLIKETMKLLRSTVPPSIEIATNILTRQDTVIADPAQLHQIILNLCTNAIHAMREGGGRLEVSLDEVDMDPEAALSGLELGPGPHIRLSVSDTGHGMAPDVVERIFDPFFTTKKPGEGTGMGLAVVHGIVRQHNGAVMVASEPGKGTAFHVFLPKSDQLPDLGLEAGEPAAPQGRATVLFVDDEKALTDIGKEMLESLGYTVTARTSSVEALEAFRHDPGRFDLVVTDQAMPNMTGLELAEAVHRASPDTPIILCTGFSETVSFKKLKSMGILDVVMKPLLKRRLAESLGKVLAPQEGAEQSLS